jgi:hypothetical protein
VMLEVPNLFNASNLYSTLPRVKLITTYHIGHELLETT